MSKAHFPLIFSMLLLVGINPIEATPLTGPGVKRAKANQYPFIVSIGKQTNRVDETGEDHHFCGGALITRQHVLTAAHCLEPKLDIRTIEVRVGSNDLRTGQVHDIKSWITYDEWAKRTKTKPKFKENDISIIELSNPVDSTVKIAKLANVETDYLYGINATTAGWGGTGSAEVSRYLQSAENLKVISRRECIRNIRRAQRAKAYVAPNVLCTNAQPYEVLTCGDSGGPLFIEGDQIIGINDSSCPTLGPQHIAREQNIHVDVTRYRDFIEFVTRISSSTCRII